jgi:hypothetical protein
MLAIPSLHCTFFLQGTNFSGMRLQLLPALVSLMLFFFFCKMMNARANISYLSVETIPTTKKKKKNSILKLPTKE